MKKLTNHILLLLAAAIMASCSGSDAKNQSADVVSATESGASALLIEKPQLTFGFIKLTDMAPLAIAKELGYFEDEGLFVTIEAQSNWKNVLDPGHRRSAGWLSHAGRSAHSCWCRVWPPG